MLCDLCGRPEESHVCTVDATKLMADNAKLTEALRDADLRSERLRVENFDLTTSVARQANRAHGAELRNGEVRKLVELGLLEAKGIHNDGTGCGIADALQRILDKWPSENRNDDSGIRDDNVPRKCP